MTSMDSIYKFRVVIFNSIVALIAITIMLYYAITTRSIYGILGLLLALFVIFAVKKIRDT